MKRLLFVVTSHAELGFSGVKTGVCLDEFAAPYYHFLAAGCAVVTASPDGGAVPISPEEPGREHSKSPCCRRFLFTDGGNLLRHTAKLSEIDPDQFDALYYPGGCGVLWDVAASRCNAGIVSRFFECNRPVGAISHGVAALLKGRQRNGAALIAGRRLTGRSNAEEQNSGMADALPFQLETRLRNSGGDFRCAGPGRPHVVRDGNLVTAQNPGSLSGLIAEMLDLLQPMELAVRT